MKTCSIEGCGGKHRARGLCSVHYFQQRFEQKESGEWVNRPRRKDRICGVQGCAGKHLAKGMCQKHYSEEIRRENREFLKERYFRDGIRCGKCGKEFEWRQMDAHHPDPDRKEHMLSELANNTALQRRPKLLEELDECEMLCARCHQNEHHDPRLAHEQTYQRKDKGRRIDEMKEQVRRVRGEKCEECGDWLYPKEMEFHHRDGDGKAGNVSTMMRFGSEGEVLAEVEKCDVVCRNCHRMAA